MYSIYVPKQVNKSLPYLSKNLKAFLETAKVKDGICSLKYLRYYYLKNKDICQLIITEMYLRGFKINHTFPSSVFCDIHISKYSKYLLIDENTNNFQTLDFIGLGLNDFIKDFCVSSDLFFDGIPIEGFKSINKNIDSTLLEKVFSEAGFSILSYGEYKNSISSLEEYTNILSDVIVKDDDSNKINNRNTVNDKTISTDSLNKDLNKSYISNKSRYNQILKEKKELFDLQKEEVEFVPLKDFDIISLLNPSSNNEAQNNGSISNNLLNNKDKKELSLDTRSINSNSFILDEEQKKQFQNFKILDLKQIISERTIIVLSTLGYKTVGDIENIGTNDLNLTNINPEVLIHINSLIKKIKNKNQDILNIIGISNNNFKDLEKISNDSIVYLYNVFSLNTFIKMICLDIKTNSELIMNEEKITFFSLHSYEEYNEVKKVLNNIKTNNLDNDMKFELGKISEEKLKLFLHKYNAFINYLDSDIEIYPGFSETIISLLKNSDTTKIKDVYLKNYTFNLTSLKQSFLEEIHQLEDLVIGKAEEMLTSIMNFALKDEVESDLNLKTILLDVDITNDYFNKKINTIYMFKLDQTLMIYEKLGFKTLKNIIFTKLSSFDTENIFVKNRIFKELENIKEMKI